MHRPSFNWEKVNNPGQFVNEKRAYDWLKKLNQIRSKEPLFSNQERLHVIDSNETSILLFTRGTHSRLWCVFNVSEHPKMITLPVQKGSMMVEDLVSNQQRFIFDGQLHLNGYDALWFKI
jgi:hypothetical protein